MADLTFDDYKSRISIQEVLKDAGYHFYRRDGLRWPCYYRLDDEGRRISGDKFIVCANGMACFQPPVDEKVQCHQLHCRASRDVQGGSCRQRPLPCGQ